MPSRFALAIRVAWRAVLAVVVLFSVLLLLWMAKAMPWPQRTIELKKIRATEGFGFTSKLPKPWPGFVFVGASGVLTEDGRELMPVKDNGLVRQNGMGAFRVGGERVLFSSSDGSDPLKNGRGYSLRLRTEVLPSGRLVIFCMGGLAALFLLRENLHGLATRMRRSAADWESRALAPAARSWALALFAIALVARCGFLWRNPDYTDRQMSIRGSPFSDARDWNGMAKSAAAGRGVDSTYPGMRAFYPMFLATFYTWTGDSPPLAKGLQAIIGAVSAALLFLMLRRAMPLWAAAATALFFALDPRQVTQASRLMTEPFGLLLIMLSAWCVIVGGERRRPLLLLAAGGFFACSNLARPLTLFVFPIYVALIAANAWLREARRWRAAFLHAGAFVLGTVICLAPWVIRERVTYGIWAISCNSSSALFAASTPEFGVWKAGVEEHATEAGVPYKVKPRYEYYQERFRENLKKYPGFYTSNVVRSFGVAAAGAENVSPAFRGAGVWAFAMLSLFALFQGGRRGVLAVTLPALAATILLVFANADWAIGFAVVGALFTLWWRLFPGLVLVVCHLGGLLGSALFGNPDLQRVRLLIDWVEAGWTFAGVFAVAGIIPAIILRLPLPLALGSNAVASRDVADEPPALWLRRIGWVLTTFLFVSAGRLVFLNAISPPKRIMPPASSDADRSAWLREFATRYPAWKALAEPAMMTGPRGWRRRAYVEFGVIEKGVFHFPPSVGLTHWSNLFEPRVYEHTSFFMHVAAQPFTGNAWAEFAGAVPPTLRDTNCLIIGLTKTRPAIAAYLENSVEAAAIIPAPDFQPDFTRALVAPVFPETQALLEAPAAPQ